MILSELRAQGWKYASLLFLALFITALIAALFFRASDIGSRADRDRQAARAAQAEAEVGQLRSVLAEERKRARRMTEIAQTYEQDKRDAKAAAVRTAADLRAGNIRLRNEWAGCETARVSEASRSAAELDAAAAVRERLAAEIVQIGHEADAQVKGLQSVIEADRSK